MPEGLNSDLDLHHLAPPRARPGVGEWGPEAVPSTAAKRRLRWFTIAAFTVMAAGLVTYAGFMYQLLR